MTRRGAFLHRSPTFLKHSSVGGFSIFVLRPQITLLGGAAEKVTKWVGDAANKQMVLLVS